jgi:hypothetical protein
LNRPAFPVLRWCALAWLLVYVPAYTVAYGVANFAFLCNLSVFLVAAGLWWDSALILSSQAVGLFMIATAWSLDLVSRLVTGSHWIGGTEYMWDPQWPLVTRCMSLYHVVIPVLLIHALRRIGYDRRGLWLQSGIALLAVPAGRLLPPDLNVNHAFVDPVLQRSFEPAALHLGLVAGVLVLIVYPLTAAGLRRFLPGVAEFNR